ncbi:MAG: hypothetical protein QW831_11095 [Candidatus Jordarchaeaceae archaeon]
MSEERPLNVMLVSLIILIEGTLMLIFGIYTGVFWLQLRSFLSISDLLLLFSADPVTYLLVFGSKYMLGFWVNLNLVRLIFLLGWFILSIIVFITFSGLKSWAYYLAMAHSIIGFIFSALFLPDLMALPLISASLLVLVYLLVSEEIKDRF